LIPEEARKDENSFDMYSPPLSVLRANTLWTPLFSKKDRKILKQANESLFNFMGKTERNFEQSSTNVIKYL
jgi:hypothetical protein